jgi:hypothetical protein
MPALGIEMAAFLRFFFLKNYNRKPDLQGNAQKLGSKKVENIANGTRCCFIKFCISTFFTRYACKFLILNIKYF